MIFKMKDTAFSQMKVAIVIFHLFILHSVDSSKQTGEEKLPSKGQPDEQIAVHNSLNYSAKNGQRKLHCS